MKASNLFIKCLEAEKIEYIFGLPGEENADLMISLADSETIKFVLVRHEQAVAFMADMYGRLTKSRSMSFYFRTRSDKSYNWGGKCEYG